MTTIAVLVPTLRRPDDLKRCITALGVQERRADQIIVVSRRDDEATLAALAALVRTGYALATALVDRPGVVHALSVGLRSVACDVVAITDDDSAPHRDWLEKIERTFWSSPRIAGVGGRDLIGGTECDPRERRQSVGRVQWLGRVVGNHHIGSGPPRRVDVLKAVNCAYRVDALTAVGFDERLKGTGAQPHFELGLGLTLIRNGWTLIYDPGILVDHFPAQRHDYDQRNTFNARALSDAVHNETLALLDHLPPLRRIVFAAWSLLCGTRSHPGLLCALTNAAGGKPNMSRQLAASLRGRIEAVMSWLRAPTTRQPAPSRRQDAPGGGGHASEPGNVSRANPP